ncbi:MAG: enamine deaminase RidA [Actinobacteria bacterium]|jgi:reactive intermediate/imine deaminase|nr:enamine deaminase RidA [Actinomycetota bacterium]HJM22298.1 RidA family protein [Acidimicrobiales bacterium]
MGTDAQRISTEPDRLAAVHISQGFRVGDLVFVSGQAAVNDQGEVVGVGDFGAQARQAVGNLDRVLQAAGSSLDQVIKVTIFVTDMSHFSEVVKLREEVFSQPYPADTICEVRALAYPELMFEIEAIALADGSTIDIAHS